MCDSLPIFYYCVFCHETYFKQEEAEACERSCYLSCFNAVNELSNILDRWRCDACDREYLSRIDAKECRCGRGPSE
jgi:hypothetical protein